MNLSEQYHQAAGAISESKALIINAGAGMGVDSGLPDFRGDKGFWNAYPMYERLGISFVDAANPVHFKRDPNWGWGFYGHRLNLYRKTEPHHGFQILQEWCKRFGLDPFIYTSNVDGQFQKSGFPEAKICEIHGSIHHLQCLDACTDAIWKNEAQVEVDLETMRAKNIPLCPQCGAVARPNILMFGDVGWISQRSSSQDSAFSAFLDAHGHEPIVVVEMGAGTAIPSIRHASDSLHRQLGAKVIRINPRESSIGKPNIGIAEGALSALQGISAAM